MTQVFFDQAVAGSGKTYRLQQALTPLLEAGHPVTFVSFTNATVDDVAKGFQHENLTITTYHKFFLRDLQRNAELFGYQAPLAVIESFEEVPALKEAMVTALEQVNRPLPERQRMSLDRFSNLRMKVSEPFRTERDTLRLLNPIVDRLLALPWEIETERECRQWPTAALSVAPLRRSVILVSEIVEKWFHASTRFPDLIPRVPFLAIDEVQDLSPEEFRLFKRYLEKADQVWLAGDPAQVIYGQMRGSSPERLKQFVLESRAEVSKSLASRRCSQAVIHSANQVLALMSDSFDRMRWMEGNATGSVTLKTDFHSAEDEARWISETIARENLDPNQTSILTRFRVHGDVDFYKRFNPHCEVDTMHSAKGKEWQNVFLANYNDTIPDNDEEKRLLYVGLTRSKNRLWLTCPRAIAVRGKVKNTRPHSYFKPLQNIN